MDDAARARLEQFRQRIESATADELADREKREPLFAADYFGEVASILMQAAARAALARGASFNGIPFGEAELVQLARAAWKVELQRNPNLKLMWPEGQG